MPELEPIHPAVLLGVLTLYGLKVLAEDADNWIMGRDIKDSNDVPVVCPKKGTLVPSDTLQNIIVEKLHMDLKLYFVLVDKVISLATGTHPPIELN